MKLERKDVEVALAEAMQNREKAMATVNLHQGSILAYQNMLAFLDEPEPEEEKPPAPTDPPPPPDEPGPVEEPQPADPERRPEAEVEEPTPAQLTPEELELAKKAAAFIQPKPGLDRKKNAKEQ